MKSAQRNKVLTDAFKLAFVARALNRPDAVLVLLFSDEVATRPFRTGWAAKALAEFGVRIEVVVLPDDVRRSIRDAQARQYR